MLINPSLTIFLLQTSGRCVCSSSAQCNTANTSSWQNRTSGHLDTGDMETRQYTHWTLDTLLVEVEGWVWGGWSGLDFYEAASRGAVRWLACLEPRQVNIMELLHILHVATWPIMATRREEAGWSRGEEDNLIMCNFDACTKLFQTPLLCPAPPLHRKEHGPAQLAAKSHIGNRK